MNVILYGALLEDYHDPLSIYLSAAKICQELTLIKLNDKWRKNFESFFHFWTAKVQDLEGIEDKPVDDELHASGSPTLSLSHLIWMLLFVNPSLQSLLSMVQK
jgi:hypothetical protein